MPPRLCSYGLLWTYARSVPHHRKPLPIDDWKSYYRAHATNKNRTAGRLIKRPYLDVIQALFGSLEAIIIAVLSSFKIVPYILCYQLRTTTHQKLEKKEAYVRTIRLVEAR
ncbi:hypothetical protein BS78_01G289600 [Paspalum vaginatum]|nr:hypothetical protein BS78_01G289600 [Paspalum vaginatum]